MNDQFALRISQYLPDSRIKVEFPGSYIESCRLCFPRIRLLLKRHGLSRSIHYGHGVPLCRFYFCRSYFDRWYQRFSDHLLFLCRCTNRHHGRFSAATRKYRLQQQCFTNIQARYRPLLKCRPKLRLRWHPERSPTSTLRRTKSKDHWFSPTRINPKRQLSLRCPKYPPRTRIYDEQAMPNPSLTHPSLREFKSLSKSHTLVPVYRTVVADLETPVSAFLRIAAEAPEAFLLESVEGGERVGRYTFIGIEPYKKMVSRGTSITVEEDRKRRIFEGDIFEELKSALSGHTPARLPGLPPFTAGAVGFFRLRCRPPDRAPALPRQGRTRCSRRLSHVLRPGHRLRPCQKRDPPHGHRRPHPPADAKAPTSAPKSA